MRFLVAHFFELESWHDRCFALIFTCNEILFSKVCSEKDILLHLPFRFCMKCPFRAQQQEGSPYWVHLCVSPHLLPSCLFSTAHLLFLICFFLSLSLPPSLLPCLRSKNWIRSLRFLSSFPNCVSASLSAMVSLPPPLNRA